MRLPKGSTATNGGSMSHDTKSKGDSMFLVEMCGNQSKRVYITYVANEFVRLSSMLRKKETSNNHWA